MKKAVIIAGVVFFVLIAYLTKSAIDFYRSIYQKNTGTISKPVVAKEKTEYNVLLMGYGGPGHDGPYLTDTMMVAHIDLKKNTIALISLPRDIWIKLPTKSKSDFHAKINSIYQLGLFPTDFPDVDTDNFRGANLMKKAVTDITGLVIDSYAAIDFTGFVRAIDIMGGVDVEVQKAFDDYEYPIESKENDLCGRDEEFMQVERFLKPDFSEEEKQQLFKDKPELEVFFKSIKDKPLEAFPCRYEHLHFDAGLVHMDGTTALKYVRSRHSAQDGNDFARGARQQQFVKAVKGKAISLGIVTKIVPLLDELKNHIKTDISPETMKKFISEAADAGNYKINTVNITDKDVLKSSYSSYGGYILIPRMGIDRWDGVHVEIKNKILGITPTPSPLHKISPTAKTIRTQD